MLLYKKLLLMTFGTTLVSTFLCYLISLTMAFYTRAKTHCSKTLQYLRNWCEWRLLPLLLFIFITTGWPVENHSLKDCLKKKNQTNCYSPSLCSETGYFDWQGLHVLFSPIQSMLGGCISNRPWLLPVNSFEFSVHRTSYLYSVSCW